MAFVVPIVAAFSTVAAAGSLAAAVGTLGGFLSVAGGVLAGVGALTGKDDLVKLGSVFSLGSGLVNMASSAANAASSAGSSGLGEVVDATGGIETAVETANAGGLAPGAYIDAGVDATGGLETAITPTGINPNAPAVVAPGGPGGGATNGGSLADQAAKITGAPSGQASISQQFTTAPVTPSAVQQGAQGLTMNDLSTWWEKAKAAGKAVGTWAERNPALVKIGGDMVAGMYGPQAEANEMQRSLMEQARRNLNSPIKLTYGGRP